MSEQEDDLVGRDDRVLLLLPTARDQKVTCGILAESGICGSPCANIHEVCREAALGAGAAIVTEEAILNGGFRPLSRYLKEQPPWSDLPVIVLTMAGEESTERTRALLEVGHVMLVKRPVDVSGLITTVQSAIRDRRRQYQVRELLVEHERQAACQKQAEEALLDADRKKDEFLAMLAHELRNPLAAINNSAEILGAPAAESDLPWVKEVISRQVKQLGRLVDDLLDVSRITRGKIELRKENLEVSRVLNQAVESVTPLIEQRQHSLTVAYTPEPLRIEADPTRLEQIVVNLLTNAAKYTHPGGKISLTVQREGPAVVIRVIDNGIGIPPEKLPSMFELFVQGDRSLARTEGGLGIGLTLVKRLAELHGATVTATSRGPGTGSEFAVSFPAAESVQPPRLKRSSVGARTLHHAARILVVDDNPDTAWALAKLLKVVGHDVRTAHDGHSALALARTQPPDYVLLDIGLPGLDGYEVATELRKDRNCREAVIIAVSGYGRDEDRRRTDAAGFDHHLVKPIDHNELLSLLAKPGADACQSKLHP